LRRADPSAVLRGEESLASEGVSDDVLYKVAWNGGAILSNGLSADNCGRISRKRPTVRAALFVAALAACSLALLAAQAPNSSPPAPAQATPSSAISVQTNLVLVRVVVRDGRGNAVADLGQSDFQLFDNGKPQAISYFSVENGAAQSAAGGTSAANSPSSNQRYTALFFDDYHWEIQSLNQTRKAAQGFVTKALNVGDRVGIFTASGQVTLDFTTDAGKLQKALSELRIATNIAAETSGSAQDCTALKDYIAQGVMDNDPEAIAIAEDRTKQCVCGNDQSKTLSCPFLSEISRIAKADAQHDLAQSLVSAEATLAALQKLVGYIGQLPGEHRISLVSDGFLNRENPARLSQVIDSAIRSDVIISAMDDYGLVAVTPNGDASVTLGYQDQQGATALQPKISKLEIQGDEDDAEVMRQTAAGTGGVFVRDTNDFKGAFDRMGAVAEVSYVIGFTPGSLALDGSYHKLKTVVTAHSNWTVQARPGYFATAASAPATAEFASSPGMQSTGQVEAAFKAIQTATDADQQIRLSQDFLQTNATSQLAEPVSNLLVAAYYAKQDWNDFFATANTALAKYPDDADVLVLFGWVTAHMYDPNDSAAAVKLDQAQSYLKHAIAVIATMPQAAGLTADQFAAHKNSTLLLAHRALGLVDLHLRDFADSVAELQLVTQGATSPNPADLWELGIGLQQLNRYADAAAAFGKCAQIPGSLQDRCKQLAQQAAGQK
jgi:VWFA-related protein